MVGRGVEGRKEGKKGRDSLVEVLEKKSGPGPEDRDGAKE